MSAEQKAGECSFEGVTWQLTPALAGYSAAHGITCRSICVYQVAGRSLPQDKFFTQLRNSADGFGVVADFFGRGLLNHTSVTAAAAALPPPASR